jgi:hypothetical protein
MNRALLSPFVVSTMLLTFAACGRPDPAPAPTSPPAPQDGQNLLVKFPQYDQVYAESGHNSYFSDNVFEPFATGNKQRISDLLLHEHVGMVEFDIKKADPGRFRVHHTLRLPGNNTQCDYLDECLARMQNFQWAVPNHEVVNIIIELKQTEPILLYASVPDIFDADHSIGQLDATLRRYLGDALFTPGEFLQRCPGASTLLECSEKAGWPTTEELRGRFIVNVLGNWSTNHYNWAAYAAGPSIRQRAAFPLRSVFGSCGEGQQDGGNDVANRPFFPGRDIPPAMLDGARKNSVFWEAGRDDAGRPRFLAADACPALQREGSDFLDKQHGILRSIDSFSADDQASAVQNRYEHIQTDFAWDFIRDGFAPITDFVTDPTRRFYDPATKRGSPPLAREALIEPGNRIYLYNFTSKDASFRFRSVEPDRSSTWEVVVSSSNVDVTQDDSHPPVRGEDGRETARGDGCLRAESVDGAEWIMVCRRLLFREEDWWRISDDQTRVVVSVYAQSSIDGPSRMSRQSSRELVSDGLGDMLRLEVQNMGNSAVATASSASSLKGLDVHGEPDYQPLRTVRFARPLVKQGLYAEGDKLFVRPRFKTPDVREITLCDLDKMDANMKRSGVIDFSWPTSCPPELPPKRVPPPEPYCPVYDAGFCYERCMPGDSGVGPLCYKPCKVGYSDDGLFCRLDARIISSDNSKCSKFDICGVTFDKGCSTCPPDPLPRHWKNDGCTCRLDVDIYAKTGTYSRGVGWIPGTR